MRRIALFIVLSLSAFIMKAQFSDMLSDELYKSRVKLLSEFISRFNGEKLNPYVDAKNADKHKMNLCQLFNSSLFESKNDSVEAQALLFVDTILTNKTKIDFTDFNWFAKAVCVGKFQGKETKFDIMLTVEPRSNDMYKWVISDVQGLIFDLRPSRFSDKIMLLPNENESNFMKLGSITSGKDDYITLYSTSTLPQDRLTVFNTLVYYNYLNIDYVEDIEYTFLQVPGFIFTVKEIERDTSNAGWLINSWNRISQKDKEAILTTLYHGKTEPLKINESQTKLPLSENEKDKLACEITAEFVSTLNTYLETKDEKVLTKLYSMCKGRYTFTISDDISNTLASAYKAKAQDSYKLDTFTKWLSGANSPFSKISVSDIEPFHNNNLQDKYNKKEFSLVSGTLSAEGNTSKISEKVLFFVYDSKIAGIKLISDCF